jgi:hypothetical protein
MCLMRQAHRPVSNVCAGLRVRSQLMALDMLHRVKEIFCLSHVPVVSSRHSGFLHHQNVKISGLAR